MFSFKKITFLIFSIFVTVISLQSYADSSAQPIDRIIAVVNEEIITQSQLDAAVDRMKQQLLKNNIALPDDQKLRQNILDQLIDQRLQLQMAKKNGITVTDAQMQKALESIAKQNNLTIEQLKEKIAEQNVNFLDFKNDLKQQLILQQVQQQAVGSEVNVTASDVKKYLDAYKKQQNLNSQYHLADILISVPDSPTAAQDAAAKAQATAILQKLNQGADMSTVTDPASGAQYSDLGWRPLQAIPEVFMSAVSQMKTGQVVGPIRAPNGYHLLKLLEVQNQAMPLPDKSQIQQMVYHQKLQKVLQPWLKQLRATSYIKIMVPQ